MATLDPPSGPRPPELVRRPRGAEGVHRIELNLTHLQLARRPRRRWTITGDTPVGGEAGGQHHLSFATDSGEKVLRVNEIERYVIFHLDGMRSVRDLAIAAVGRFGVAAFDAVPAALARASAAGLVELPELADLRRRSAAAEPGLRQRLMAALERPFADVDPFFKAWAGRLRWAFHPGAVAVQAAVAFAGLGAWAQELGPRGLWPGPLAGWQTVALCLLGLALFTIPHELGHGVAVRWAGRRVPKAGFTLLDGLVPSFYVDTTQLLLEPVRRRVIGSMAGPWVNLVAAGLLGAVAVAVGEGLARDALDSLILSNLLLLVWTAWPFFGFSEDGYNALVDVIDVEGLAGHGRSVGPLPPRLSPRARAWIWLWRGAVLGSWLAVCAAVFGVLTQWGWV
jgi:putative peptide zinc metalloprotease protein